MKIQTIKGHLTQTEKIHIKALFDAQMKEGRVNRKNYWLSITENSDEWEVTIKEKGRNDWGDQIINKHIAKFKIVK